MSVIIDGTTGIDTPAVTTDSFTANTLNSTTQVVNGITVGKGGGAVSTNTAVGDSALASNTSGSLNTAVGLGTLGVNTTGLRNLAVGVNALGTNTSGSYSTALGQGALQSNTTASNNTAVGYQAGYSNTTGTGGNVLVGYQAGYTNSTGAYNTIVGITAGANLTSSNNTMIGVGAGLYVTSGAKNTILGGYNGNQGGLDIRTASNYIVLSDGDGNPRAYCNNAGGWVIKTGADNLTLQCDAAVGAGLVTAESFKNAAGSYVGAIYINSTSTQFATSSDYRLKENIAPMVGALDKVNRLKPCTYSWKSNGTTGQGFIAHELQEVCPDAVYGEKDAINEDGSVKPQQIDTSFLVATLTAAIQELNAKVEAQALEIATLKGTTA